MTKSPLVLKGFTVTETTNKHRGKWRRYNKKNSIFTSVIVDSLYDPFIIQYGIFVHQTPYLDLKNI